MVGWGYMAPPFEVAIRFFGCLQYQLLNSNTTLRCMLQLLLIIWRPNVWGPIWHAPLYNPIEQKFFSR